MKTYLTCSIIKSKIDKVLHENVKLFQNLGIDSTLTEKREAVRHLDEKYIDGLLIENK
tara:strand:- start:9869 stop:10042 length:174 start_codon:yes stop_codon:yes gene_type:complete